jgi:tetratricopeptide (TPR) repeat protein
MKIGVPDIIDIPKIPWHRKSAIFVIIVFVFVSFLLFFSGLKLTDVSLDEWVIILFSLILIFAFWYQKVRIPRNKKECIGFIVAISAETEEQYNKIVQDFILHLRDLISKGNLTYSFNFITLPQHHAIKIQTVEDARRYLNIIRGHFMVFGKARVRKVQNEDKHVIDINGIVRHNPLSIQIGRAFSAEFSSIFPSRMLLSTQNDLLGFEFTSDLVNFIARYVIGIASLYSGDYIYSESVFKDLQVSMKMVSSSLPPIIKIKQRIPEWLNEIYFTRILIAYRKYREIFNADSLSEMEYYLNEVNNISPNNYTYLNYRSILYFIKDRDTESARRELSKCKKGKDILWRYNIAFIYAYEGDMAKATQQYQIAFRDKSIPENKIFEIEEFISWILEEEPDKIQLSYCLGLINYMVKNDYVRALKDFEKFLENVIGQNFEFQQDRARKYVEDINKMLKTTSQQVEEI